MKNNKKKETKGRENAGEGTKVQFYCWKNTSPRISLPISITNSLNWKHKNTLIVNIVSIEGKIGLFITKSEDD